MSKKVFYGIVVDKSGFDKKTIKVLVLRVYRDRVYKKIIRKYKRYTAHDENNTCKSGDGVLIQESRPISASKRWIVVRSSNEGGGV